MSSERVFLSGGNGFIGAHILKQLLGLGYYVRTSVRSQEKVDQVKHDQGEHKGTLDVVVVEDLEQEGAFDKVLQADPPFTAVIHSASPFHFGEKGSNKEVYLDPAKKGTFGILKSIVAHAPHVKRVAVTSSFASVIDPNRDQFDGHAYSEKDWDPLTYEDCLESSQAIAYRGSKTIAEHAAWDFVKDNKVNFEVTTLCPPIVYGPIAHSVKSLDSLNTSVKGMYTSFIKDKKDTDKIPDETTWIFVDVRDLANAHIVAITNPKAAGKRILVTAGTMSNQRIADLLREADPKLEKRVPKGNPGTSLLKDNAYSGDNSFSKSLGINYLSDKQTVTDMAKQFLELEAKHS